MNQIIHIKDCSEVGWNNTFTKQISLKSICLSFPNQQSNAKNKKNKKSILPDCINEAK